MHKRYITASYRLFFGTLTLIAVIAQLLQVFEKPNASLVNFFSFFTIESNIFAAGLFIVSGMLLLQNKSVQKLNWFRGAATLYMVTTGTVYVLLLSGLEESLQTTLPWVNFILHYLFPIIVVADWLIAPPKKKLTSQQALLWLVFPLLYVAYSLLRGHITAWYPYPFLNPTDGGYISVAITAIVIAFGMLGIAWILQKLRVVK